MLTTQEREYLLNSMQELLAEYDYTYTTDALESIIDEWSSQKAELIEAFKKHPHYLEGKFMIAFATDYERELDIKAVNYFSDWLQTWVMEEYKDTVPDEMKEQREREGFTWLPGELFAFFVDITEHITGRTISDETFKLLDKIIPEVHPHAGEKSTRLINRLCTYLGYNKHPDYNREYGKFADAMSPIKIKRHTVLSINPLDYLTMSFGNTWASCHTIDKNNKRRMPNNYSGCYSSGTMSYMLDKTSMVFYTVESTYDGDEYWGEPKVHRQMFHWGQEKLIQSRLYPQENDGYTDIYTPYRNLVQEIIADIFGFPNLWTIKRGTDAASEYIYSEGTHYRDYCHFSSCVLSRIKDSTNDNYITVGADPICVQCGNRHDTENNINCCRDYGSVCERCGCVIEDGDDVIWIDGEPYCSDCVYWCDCCDEYTLESTTEVYNGSYVCDYCLQKYYSYCEECHEYYINDDTRYVEAANGCVCNECLDRYYTKCYECGEYHHNDNITYISRIGKDICDDCLNQYYETCDKCGEYYYNDDLIKTDNGWFCPNCDEEEEQE